MKSKSISNSKLLDSSDISKTESSDNNPLYDIENDIRNLIKLSVSLKKQVDDNNKMWEVKEEKFVLDLIEVIDAFERLFDKYVLKGDELSDETKKWILNFKTIYKMLNQSLKVFKVNVMETLVGQIADPHFHKIIDIIERNDLKDDTILEITKKGYFFNDSIIRYAEVNVVKNK